MAKVFQTIDERLRDFIERQHLFFVATAPLAAEGHVNLSPRGVPGTSCVVEDRRFAWLDLAGSGSETIAHLRENGHSLDGLAAYDFDPLDEWSTLDGLAAIRERLESVLDGWRAPAAYGVALGGEFPHVNLPGGRHGLPAVVLGTVLKHDGSTATIEMTPAQLAEAITTLAPAEACTDVDHPNLAAWRRVLAEADGKPITVVFVGSLDDDVTSDADAILRSSL